MPGSKNNGTSLKMLLKFSASNILSRIIWREKMIIKTFNKASKIFKPNKNKWKACRVNSNWNYQLDWG